MTAWFSFLTGILYSLPVAFFFKMRLVFNSSLLTSRYPRYSREAMPKSRPASPAPKHRAQHSSRQVAYRFSRFSPAYRARLLRGLCDLQHFCRRFACASLRQLLKHPKLADHEFSKYVMMKYEDGKNSTRSTVKHALLGCQHLAPQLKGTCSCLGEHASVGGTTKTQT